jgi:HEPN domain-containing protein
MVFSDMDIEKQVVYWSKGSQSDMEAARLLISGGKTYQGLYFAHLALEKARKALVVRVTKKHPPKVHSLLILTERAGLEMPAAELEFLSAFDVYQLQGRYPDTELPELSHDSAERDLERAG